MEEDNLVQHKSNSKHLEVSDSSPKKLNKKTCKEFISLTSDELFFYFKATYQINSGIFKDDNSKQLRFNSKELLLFFIQNTQVFLQNELKLDNACMEHIKVIILKEALILSKQLFIMHMYMYLYLL
jgi:hypothetical protein